MAIRYFISTHPGIKIWEVTFGTASIKNTINAVTAESSEHYFCL